ncbi:MAG: hypothetical protein Q9171_003634 [Xanthocarpia ochracea]
MSRPLPRSNQRRLNHQNPSLLSKTPTLDFILSTTSYTLSLLSTLVSPSPSHPNSLLSHYASLHLRLSNLSSLLSSTRITLRLFSLPSIYVWAYSEYQKWARAPHHSSTPPRTIDDTNIINSITLTQIVAGFTFQILENLAYLGDNNILPLNAQTRAKFWRWCCRAWALHVFLDIAKLLRQRHLGNTRPEVKDATKQLESANGGQDIAEREAQWWRELKINLAYAPMTLHYSLENGVMSDSLVALCGVLASTWGLKGAWKKTAAVE